jgi:hypothetical protein
MNDAHGSGRRWPALHEALKPQLESSLGAERWKLDMPWKKRICRERLTGVQPCH